LTADLFASDMSSLVFEVLSGVSHTAVGRAQLDHIATLSPRNPISGHVTLFWARSSRITDRLHSAVKHLEILCSQLSSVIKDV